MAKVSKDMTIAQVLQIDDSPYLCTVWYALPGMPCFQR